MKRLKKWQIVLIVLGVLVVLGTIIDRVEYYKDPQAYTESSIRASESRERESIARAESQAIAESERQEKREEKKAEATSPVYTIDSIDLNRSGMYASLEGTLTANKDRKLFQIKAEFYDKDGVVLDQTYGYIGDIEKGKKYKFKVLTTCDSKEVASYKIID